MDNRMIRGRGAVAGALMLIAAMVLLGGCAWIKGPQAAETEDAGYRPRMGDWCQYSVHGNLQLRILVLDVDRASVFLAREFSAGGEVLRSEQAQVPLAKLRGFVSDSYRDAEWAVAGTDVINLRGGDYNAEVRETLSHNGGTLRVWVVDDIPVTGVALVQEIGAGGGSMKIDSMKAVNWGRLKVAEEEKK